MNKVTIRFKNLEEEDFTGERLVGAEVPEGMMLFTDDKGRHVFYNIGALDSVIMEPHEEAIPHALKEPGHAV